MRNKSIYYIYIVGLILLNSNTIIAQRPLSSTVKEVVISTNKKEVEKEKVSQTIDVIEKSELELNNATNAADALQNTGMIAVQKSQGGGGSPILRGFEANRVMLVVDGIRLNSAIFRAGHLQNVLRVPNSMLDNVEILYGAASTLYGSSALGGVINFQTIQPKYYSGWQGGASFDYATATNTYVGSGQFSYGNYNFTSLTSLTFSSFGDIIQGKSRQDAFPDFGLRPFYQKRINNRDTAIANPNPNKQVQSGYYQYDILQKFRYKSCENISHSFNFQFTNTSDVPRYDRLTLTNSQGTFKDAEWYYGPEQRLAASYGLDVRTNMKIYDRYKILASYQNLKESRNRRSWNDNNRLSQKENVNIVSIDADFFKTTERHDITYGLEGILNWVGSKGIYTDIMTNLTSPAPSRYGGKGSNTGEYSAYVQDIFTITPELAYLNFGGRFTYNHLRSNLDTSIIKYPFDKVTNNNFAFTGNVGLNLWFSKLNMLSFNVSNGFRSPNVDDMTKLVENANYITINKGDLKPEKTTNLEIKSTNKIIDVLNLEMGMYYTILQDAIVSSPSTFNGSDSFEFLGTVYPVYALTNAESGYVWGAYAHLDIDFSTHFFLRNSFNYTYGRAKTAETEIPLDHIPPITGSSYLEYKDKISTVSFGVQYNGAKKSNTYRLNAEDNERYSYDPINGYMPAWYILNIKSMFKLGKVVQLNASIENLLDRNYRTFASGISAPGRNFKLGVKAFFK